MGGHYVCSLLQCKYYLFLNACLLSFLYKTVWAVGQLLRELPSSSVCRHSLQCLTAFRECLEGKEKRSDWHRKHVGNSLNGTARPNYYRKSRFISESIIMRLTSVQDLFDAFLSFFFFGGGGK